MMLTTHPKIITAQLDQNFHLFECSASFERFVGCLFAELSNKNFLDTISQETSEAPKEIRTNIASGLSWFGELCFLARNGKIVWAEVSFVLHEGAIYFSGIEITEQKKIQVAAIENLRFQEMLMSEAPVGILLSSPSGECEHVNQKWLELSGLRPMQALGTGWLDAVHPEDRVRVLKHWELALSGHQDSIEYRYLKGTGEEAIVLAHCRLVQGRQVLRIEDDLTDLRQQQHIVQEQQQRIIQDSKLVSLGAIAAGIAHEINNPLAIAMGFMEELQSLDSSQVERRDNIFNRVRRNLERIEKIVLSTKSLSGKGTKLEIEAVDLNELRTEVLSVFESNSKFQEISIDWDDNHLPEVQSRYGELLQVMLNLITNAVHAVAKCSKKVIHVQAVVTPRTVDLIVQDSGPGIPSDIIHHIFDPFFTTKEPGVGTGLGLSISKTLMLNLGGSLELEKPFPATFRLSIPRVLKEVIV